MPGRKNYSTGALWEPIVGYSRAVRVGNVIEVSGTCAVGADGQVAGINDPYMQTKRCLQIIAEALRALDASMTDVVRTRMYVTDISSWESVGKAHGEAFGKIRPATTMVEVSKLISPEYLVEIEVTAIIQS